MNTIQPIQQQSKTTLLAGITNDHALLELIGSAWRLYFSLVMNEGGDVIGTYDEIGEKHGVGGRTLRNWAKHLDKNGILKCQSKGNRVELRLLEPHLSIAVAPDHIPVEQPESGISMMNGKHLEIIKIYDAASQIGSQIELKVLLNASDTSDKQYRSGFVYADSK